MSRIDRYINGILKQTECNDEERNDLCFIS